MESKCRNKELTTFAKLLSGKFTNKEQSYKSPNQFAHINIYFRPLPWSLFETYSFYSEQSFEYDKWSPYRQAVVKLSEKGELFILENYKIHQSERFAGGGFDNSLIKSINKDRLIARNGCAMQFRKIRKGHYFGKIITGRECIVSRNKKRTYLVSNVDLYNNKLISLDEGYDIETNKKVWGSEHGQIECIRKEYFEVPQ